MKILKRCFMLVVFFLVVGGNVAFSEDRDSSQMRQFTIANPNSKPSQEFVIVPHFLFGMWLESEDGAIYEGPNIFIKNNSDIPYTIYPRIRSVIVTDTGSQHKSVGYLDLPGGDKITNDVGLDGEVEPGFRKNVVLLFKNIDPTAKSLTLKIKDISGEPGSHIIYGLTATYVKLDTIAKFKKTTIKWTSADPTGLTDADWKDLFKKNKQQWGLTDFTFKPQKPAKVGKAN